MAVRLNQSVAGIWKPSSSGVITPPAPPVLVPAPTGAKS